MGPSSPRIRVRPLSVALAALLSGLIPVVGAAATSLVATVPVTGTARGVAVNTTTDRIYVTTDGGVVVLDSITNTQITTIAVSSVRGPVAVNSQTNRIYVLGSNIVTVIDGDSNTVLSPPIGVASWASDLAVSETTNRIYVAEYGVPCVRIIDGADHATIGAVSCGYASGIAVNQQTNTIWVATYDHVHAVDGSTNSIIKTINGISSQSVHSVAVNPYNNRAYVTNSSNGASTVSVFDGSSYTQLVNISIPNPYAVAVNPLTNRIYVAGPGALRVIDGSTNGILEALPIGSQDPVAVAVHPTRYRVYAASRAPEGSSVSVFTEDADAPVTTADVAVSGASAVVISDEHWTRGDWMTELSCIDLVSGCGGSSYQVDAGVPTSYTEPFALTTEGRHQVSYQSTDRAGNVEDLRSFNRNIDRGAPIGRMVTTDGSISTPSSAEGVDLEAIVSDPVLADSSPGSGLAFVCIEITRQLAETPLGGILSDPPFCVDAEELAGRWTTSTMLETGRYKVLARSTDLVGNVSQSPPITIVVVRS